MPKSTAPERGKESSSSVENGNDGRDHRHDLSSNKDPTADTDKHNQSNSNAANLKDRLFNLRMKINQGRKSNKSEVEEEYKRLSDPKYVQRQRYIQKKAGIGSDNEPADADKEASTRWISKEDDYMQQTAEQAEHQSEKDEQKQRNVATFGWHAFTSEATHRAYEKRLKKLPTRSTGSSNGSSSAGAESALQADPLSYGRVGASVTTAGLDRLSKDVEDRIAAREKFSQRRKASESVDVDYINDKNAAYNKKLKRAFDKYTVEIRQNLERGTAI